MHQLLDMDKKIVLPLLFGFFILSVGFIYPAYAIEKPDIIVSHTEIDFGDVVVGESSSESFFSIANLNGPETVTLNFSISLDDATNFTIASNSCGASLLPGESCVVGLIFTPISDGAKHSSVAILSDDHETSVILIDLFGTGISDNAVDSDGDGVPDVDDVCEGFDDTVDTDSDGIPDGCDIEVVPLSCGGGTIQQGNECVVDPALTQQVSNLEDTLEEKNQEITTLNGIIDALEQTIADLTAQLEDALQIIADLEDGMPWNNNNANENASPGPIGKKP
ncbi:hypothetical protein NKOR_04235 [Candidatus Nitrosopumilus koreensis AR1]|uniref:Cep192/Spd-2-like domain-containing protein n=1 Tax=Candidatus Nitrosopumilus koreensis AR1 TaxID=1229908 RepID=K0B6H2_9ARCH|nr:MULTISPECIES: choice-of-anchor D domain-containing protein [Nitrosopumilus]AFS80737.1 hypothetical protein NKOR_04235 [Candidatus Nitrosopumilus koreensis AR1]